MKIMLVCVAGITTNVLMNKLQNYADKTGCEDQFTACRADNAGEMLQETDVLMIAPQARFMTAETEKMAKDRSIPVLYLEKKDLYHLEEKKIFEKINAYRSITTRVDRKLRPVDLLYILCDAVVSCIPIFIIAILSWIGMKLWQVEFCVWTWEVSGGMLCLYLMFATGYFYAKRFGRMRLSSGFIAVLGPLILMPTDNLTFSWGIYTAVGSGYIDLGFFHLKNMFFLLPCALLDIYILDRLAEIRLIRNAWRNVPIRHVIEASVQEGIILALFLTVRFLLSLA